MTTLIAKARDLFGRAATAEQPATSAPAPKKVIREFHAVSIVPGPRCCDEARALRDQRYVSRAAPALPLKNCDRSDCTCRYQHHDDRRAGLRRTSDMGVAVDGWLEVDRRESTKARGRRKKDKS